MYFSYYASFEVFYYQNNDKIFYPISCEKLQFLLLQQLIHALRRKITFEDSLLNTHTTISRCNEINGVSVRTENRMFLYNERNKYL